MCDWAVKVVVENIKPDDIGGLISGTLLEEVIQQYLNYHKHNASVYVELPPKQSPDV